jgi:hypothetical protein
MLSHINMKTACITLFTWLSAFCLYAQSQQRVIVLTSKDVDTNHVRVATHSNDSYQNLVLLFPGKKSDVIKAIANGDPHGQIVKDGVVMVEADFVCGVGDGTSTNCIGLVLGFKTYDQAKLAEKTLRGN